MNEKHALFIWTSYGLTAALLLWNWLAPKLTRNELRRQLSEHAADEESPE
jgi:heme exporter protein CcmD